MEEEIYARVKLLLDSKFDGNVSALARLLEIRQQTVNDYILRKTKMSLGFIVKLVEVVNVSPNWLLKGVGPMQETAESNSVHMEQVQIGDGNAIDAHAQANVPVVDSKLAEENLKLKIENEILRKDREYLFNMLRGK